MENKQGYAERFPNCKNVIVKFDKHGTSSARCPRGAMGGYDGIEVISCEIPSSLCCDCSDFWDKNEGV
jgi:hypothetical protein